MPPWELLDKSTAWIDWAVMAMNAEAHAQEMQQRTSTSVTP